MKVEHQFEVVAMCPVDGKADVYACTVRTSRVIPVEEILAATKELESAKIYQEQLTRELHRALSAEVETVGWHGRVRTRVIVGVE